MPFRANFKTLEIGSVDLFKSVFLCASASLREILFFRNDFAKDTYPQWMPYLYNEKRDVIALLSLTTHWRCLFYFTERET
jgi:hypothetical protein